jgi:hypothetical protein
MGRRRSATIKKSFGGGSSNSGIDLTSVMDIFRKEPLEKETIESYLSRGGKITIVKERRRKNA